MDVSVIIPYYNADASARNEQLLERAVRSVVNALDGICLWQVVVVDDGSSRSPKDIIEKFHDYDVSLINISHGGLGTARNCGIDAAQGDIISFLHADDFYIANIYAQCASHMIASDLEMLHYRHLDLYGTDALATSPGTQHSDTAMFKGPVTGDAYMLSGGLFASSCLFLVRKDVLDRHRLRFINGHTAEDEEFTPRLLSVCTKVGYTTSKAYAYCHRQGTITSAENLEYRIAEALYALESLDNFRKEHPDSAHKGLDRKIETLTVDVIRLSLEQADWVEKTEELTDTLKTAGLYPIKKRAYSTKHIILTLLVSCRAGRRLLKLARVNKS